MMHQNSFAHSAWPHQYKCTFYIGFFYKRIKQIKIQAFAHITIDLLHITRCPPGVFVLQTFYSFACWNNSVKTHNFFYLYTNVIISITKTAYYYKNVFLSMYFSFQRLVFTLIQVKKVSSPLPLDC